MCFNTVCGDLRSPLMMTSLFDRHLWRLRSLTFQFLCSFLFKKNKAKLLRARLPASFHSKMLRTLSLPWRGLGSGIPKLSTLAGLVSLPHLSGVTHGHRHVVGNDELHVKVALHELSRERRNVRVDCVVVETPVPQAPQPLDLRRSRQRQRRWVPHSEGHSTCGNTVTPASSIFWFPQRGESQRLE